MWAPHILQDPPVYTRQAEPEYAFGTARQRVPERPPEMAKRQNRMTARAEVRRQQQEPSVWDERSHPSNSLEESRRWYAEQIAKQMRKGGLFEDPFLPASSTSIGQGLIQSGRNYEWRRPHEIIRDPQFVTDGISRFDVVQGEIGDCWFLAAVASLSMYRDLMQQVVPFGQSFDSNRSNADGFFPYCGMFWFRFWRFGQWLDVVVDDRLPTRNGRLVFMRSTDRNEFWSALMEKAYVKLAGSYDAMRGGATSEAMEDFTGGLTEIVSLGEKTPPNLFSLMEIAQKRTSLMACAIEATADRIEAEGPHGLITGHAYSITDVRRVQTHYGQVELVRLRNPWGSEHEWNGPWGDKSSEWRNIPPDERKRMGLTFENDGEFWMSFKDFTRYFTKAEFCHLGPASGSFGSQTILEKRKRRWEMTQEEGEWVKYATAGGCRNYRDTFHINPQFRVQVIDPDETDDDNYGSIIVGLMQESRVDSNTELQTIGYAIYRLKDHREGLLGKAFFLSNNTVGSSQTFTNLREVTNRHRLPPGEYMIVPSTFEPNKQAKFILRVFSERPCPSE
ncbi:hypothetical protein T265_11348 [Opisthorchis viverrini]|uniref:Calpain catalytic domain-containing protein n=1 Tax=Opisthorchis viverrini TaxID=6198 RepID=A0A074YYZ2_OPIVI|nr:hypothetical protein T265_11348 [Opisthorchis viverrini]KER20011.1 hypothetical protein T265_11348 [Opisthorchis viverrini]